jgi:hypothetical protein
MSRSVFILEHYVTSELFAAVDKALSNVYSDKEVPNNNTPTDNKILGHRKCLFVISAHQATQQLKL